MFCPNCGNQLQDNAAFCTKCGTRMGQPAGAPGGGQIQPPPQPMQYPTTMEQALAAQKQAYNPYPGGAPQATAQSGGLDVGDCISQGWAMVKPNLGIFILGTIIYMVVSIAIGLVPFGIASIFLSGPLVGGFFVFCFKALDGGTPEVGDIFKGFSRFVPLMLLYIVMGIFVAIGLLLLIIPGIYLIVSYAFAIPLVIDQNLDFWNALETSRKTVGKCWWSIFGLMLLNGLVILLGILALGIGVVIAIPVCMCSFTYAYTRLFPRMRQLP
jgi:hypothetical protein